MFVEHRAIVVDRLPHLRLRNLVFLLPAYHIAQSLQVSPPVLPDKAQLIENSLHTCSL